MGRAGGAAARTPPQRFALAGAGPGPGGLPAGYRRRPAVSDVPSDVRSAQERVIAHRRVASVQVSPTVSLPEAATERYAGLVTRSIAFALDGAVVNGCALLVGVVVGLALSVLHLPSKADALVAAVGGIVWLL